MNLQIDIECNYILELNNILFTRNISTLFQPIVNLSDGEVIGYEALSRGPKGSVLEYPNILFSTAEKANKTWDLELLCRKKAIESASKMNSNKLLFINVSPHIFHDIKFRKGFTKSFLAENNINHKNIIIEITEKSAIEDYNQFYEALNHYTEQGYKIAIDDTGAGYSGLKMLSDVKPHFIKIDMELIRNIDKDTFKQALIESFVKLTNLTNMKLIAEGIETREELLTLIHLGVYAGQGYFLSRPSLDFLDISSHTKEEIILYNAKNNSSRCCYNIGQLPKYDLTFDVKSRCETVSNYLENTDIPGACILENGNPVGLIMKHIIDSKLATTYGVSVFYKRPISLLMDNEPIIADYYTDVREVSKLAMSRCNNKIYDCIIVTKDDSFYGIVTIKSLLEFITTIEYDYAKGLNPLTGLPGNMIIQQNFNSIINTYKICCVLYLDLDNFKIYNDIYGFKNGDRIINLISKIIQSEISHFLNSRGFVGHIGGDDFICILDESIEKCNEFCQRIIYNFDNEVLEYFNEEDINKGYITSIDQSNKLQKYSLTSISIAGLYGDLKGFSKLEDLGVYMASIKKQVKNIKGSSHIINTI